MIKTNVPKYDRDLTAEDIRNMVGESPFIIEVGCNDGEHTARFLEAMPNCHVCCFDPDYRAIEDFKTRNLDGPIVLHEFAISDRVEIRPLWLSGGIPDCNNPKKGWHKSTSVVKPKKQLERSPEITFTNGLPVQCYPLDYFWDEYQLPVDFLWCDAQGSERLVILGGQRTLMQTRYAIFEYYDDEVYERQADLRGLLSFLPDFDLMAIYGENALFKNRSL